MTHETAVFSTEAQFLNITQVMTQEVLIAATDDPDGISVIGGERLQGTNESISRDCRLWIPHDRSKGTIVIEHEKTLLC